MSVQCILAGQVSGVTSVNNKTGDVELMASDIPGAADLTNEQEITGKKTFSNTTTKFNQGNIEINGTTISLNGEEISFLPSATASDNGKFLRVVNGSWVAVAIENANGVSF